MMRIRLAVGAGLMAVAMTVGGGNAGAADKNQHFQVRGLGSSTCSKFIADRNADIPGSVKYADWFTGFLTAYNYLQPDTYEIAPKYEAKELLAYLDLFCDKNPKVKIAEAAVAFVHVVYDKRLKTRPK